MNERSSFVVVLQEATPAAGATIPFSVPFNAELVSAVITLGTAGTTVSTLDLQKNGATVFAGQNASAGPVSIPANSKTSGVVGAVNGDTLGTQITNNVTSGYDIIDPVFHDGVPLATLTPSDTFTANVTAVGTGAAGLSVTLYFQKA